MSEPLFIESVTSVREDAGGVFFHQHQEIPDDFLDHLKEVKANSTSGPIGNWHMVASIPEEVCNIWQTQGYDVMRMSAREIKAKLSRDGLDVFITTGRSV